MVPEANGQLDNLHHHLTNPPVQKPGLNSAGLKGNQWLREAIDQAGAVFVAFRYLKRGAWICSRSVVGKKIKHLPNGGEKQIPATPEM